MAVLREMAQLGIEGYVFPGLIRGFRSTLRDWCAEATNCPREPAEAALAHALPKVEAGYQCSELLEKRRRLMTDWARFPTRSIVAGEVVRTRPLRDGMKLWS